MALRSKNNIKRLTTLCTLLFSTLVLSQELPSCNTTNVTATQFPDHDNIYVSSDGKQNGYKLKLNGTAETIGFNSGVEQFNGKKYDYYSVELHAVYNTTIDAFVKTLNDLELDKVINPEVTHQKILCVHNNYFQNEMVVEVFGQAYTFLQNNIIESTDSTYAKKWSLIYGNKMHKTEGLYYLEEFERDGKKVLYVRFFQKVLLKDPFLFTGIASFFATQKMTGVLKRYYEQSLHFINI